MTSSVATPCPAATGAPGAGLGLAILSAASFGTSGSFARALSEAGWSPGAEVAARVSLAALLLVIPGVLALRGRLPALRRGGSAIMFYGVVAVAGCQLCYFNAIQHLSIGVALLIEYLGTVLVVLWMWLRHGHAPRRLTIIGTVLAIAGLVLVLDLTSAQHVDALGVAWALGAALGLAAYYVLSGDGDTGVPPIAFASGGMIVGAVALFGLGAIGALPLHATFGDVSLAGRAVAWWLPVLGLGLVAAAIAYVTGIGAARLLGAKLASFVGLTEVLFAVLFAWLFLGELPTAIQLAGGALILVGVAVVRADELAPG